MQPDEGVAVEIGIATALGKPVFLFRDDFRKATDSQMLDCNLMLYAGLPLQGWERHLYRSLDEISDPEKMLVEWAAQHTSSKL